jgi:ABC-2 type transport system ATP-binding protein
MITAISLQGVTKQYDTFALQDVDLSLPEGQVMGLIGINGAGKSTLLRLLMGLIRADRGEVRVFGQALPDAQVAVKRDIGYASDDMRLRWHMDLIRRVYPNWEEAYAAHLIQRFQLRPAQTLGGFSHGQRVKALLLLLLARHPRLLLLDEPTTGLDPVARGEVLDALGDVLRDERRSILFSSHNTAEVEQIADVITFLHEGRVLALPGLASVRCSPPLIELKTSAFDHSTLPTLQALGLTVDSVEAMSLEDIFITTVGKGKAQ